MRISVQTHFIFSICIVLYFTSSDRGSCHGREDDSLRQIISFSEEENEKYSTQINPTNPTIFNVVEYGAKGDGATNDAEAFVKAWSAACKVNGGVMLVPTGSTFLLQALDFEGSSCQPNVVVQVDGTIVAPEKSKWFNKNDDRWIQFLNSTKGLTIKGNGVIDGKGESWWAEPTAKEIRPHALKIWNCWHVTVTGITIQNAPRMHIFVESGQYLQIYNFTTSSPGDSPNTDGIHITHFQHVDIHNCTLACGDDCVSIQAGCSDVKVHDVYCGPGHGYSIGGLGLNQSEAEVSDVTVSSSAVQNSLTGVRIKTWPGASGYVRNVTFSNIRMIDVKTPIVIDQHYCGGPKNCSVTETNAIAVSNITYEKITGTFTFQSISLDCSLKVPCRGLVISSVNLTPSPILVNIKQAPLCSQAHGTVLRSTTPPLEKCLLFDGASSLAMSPEPDYLFDMF